jgi:hypothetical protein
MLTPPFEYAVAPVLVALVFGVFAWLDDKPLLSAWIFGMACGWAAAVAFARWYEGKR